MLVVVYSFFRKCVMPRPDNHLESPPKKRYRLSFLGPKLKRFPEELEMKRYGGIDLHSNNSVIHLVDDNGEFVLKKRAANDLSMILALL